eukprot:TRINITY_DN65961_c0_g1_i1.p1 TRINITY_DN65961_c0_g1~~TRINITY_DN65961_c0_g1_i1.p1  ORF type:complete len:207 (-),score=18.70 TRINITY_DN65961_c0_g1_i1:30-650(-)
MTMGLARTMHMMVFLQMAMSQTGSEGDWRPALEGSLNDTLELQAKTTSASGENVTKESAKTKTLLRSSSNAKAETLRQTEPPSAEQPHSDVKLSTDLSPSQQNSVRNVTTAQSALRGASYENMSAMSYEANGSIMNMTGDLVNAGGMWPTWGVSGGSWQTWPRRRTNPVTQWQTGSYPRRRTPFVPSTPDWDPWGRRRRGSYSTLR